MATEGISNRSRDPFNLNQAEAGDYNAVSTVKKEADAAISKAKEPAISVAHWPEPSKALDDQYSADVMEFVKNSTANAKPAAAPSHAASSAATVGVAANAVAVKQKVTTGLGVKVDKLTALSPSLQKDVKQLKKNGWHIQYGPAGESSTHADTKQIFIDGSLKNDPTNATQDLAHEVGHATYPKLPDYTSKESYVKSMLASEGAATMNNIKAQREIKKNGGPNIGIAGNQANHDAYNAAYNQYLRDGNAEAARNAIGSKYGDGEIASGTEEQTYNEYYGSGYNQMFPLRLQVRVW